MSRNTDNSRRDFIRKSTAAGVVAGLAGVQGVAHAMATPVKTRPAPRPIAISSRNGDQAVLKAIELIQSGSDALDAVVAGVNLVEEDPNVTSVGYGGLPNADGVVQLDSATMHGPSCRAGAVACIEGIKYPSRVAVKVLRRTDHVLLVGKGAQDFARLHGFPVEDLLTDRARERWLEWKENMSTQDEYLPEHGMDETDIGMNAELIHRTWGTIHCSAIDLAGNISGVTTTSGLAFKIPGRVGDSPIIGAGIYVDNEVGAAGSTGRGEANLESLACFLIVERMRAGDSPEDACLYACRRISDKTKEARLRDENGRPNFNVQFYALNKAGEVGGAEIWGGNGKFTMADSDGGRLVDLAPLYKRG